MTTLNFVFVAEPVESVIPELMSVIIDESFRYAKTTNDVGVQELNDYEVFISLSANASDHWRNNQ